MEKREAGVVLDRRMEVACGKSEHLAGQELVSLVKMYGWLSADLTFESVPDTSSLSPCPCHLVATWCPRSGIMCELGQRVDEQVQLNISEKLVKWVAESGFVLWIEARVRREMLSV